MADVASTGQLHEFLRVLRRRRWQIVMPAIYVLALGTVFAVLVPKKYVISTRVELLEGVRAESDPALKNRAGSAVMREVDNVAVHLSNYSRIEEVVQNEAGLWPEYVTADAEGRREVIERIQDNLSVSQVEKRRNEGSTFVDIEYRDVSGDRAVQFLEDLIDLWVREVVERDKNNLEAEREQAQNAEFDATVARREALEDYKSLAMEIGVDPSAPFAGSSQNRPADPIQQQLSFVEEQLLEVQKDIAPAEEAHRLARELYEQADERVPANLEVDFFELEQRVEKAIEELEEGRDNLTPENSKWRLVQRRIDELREDLEEERKKLLEEPPLIPNPDLRGLEQAEQLAYAKLQELRAAEVHLQNRIHDLEEQRNRRIDQIAELADLKLELDTRTAAYDEANAFLRSRLAALSQLGAYDDPYDIIQRPEVEGAPREPSAILLVLMAAFAGLALGLALALAAEYARNSYRTVADVAQVMAAPVLGTVDQIVTSVEARRIQARRAVVGLSSAVILGGLAWFTWIWSDAPQKLPVGVQRAIDEFRKLLM